MVQNQKISLKSPIGIFDSGLGGLTVALEVSKLLPDEKIIYVGDNAHFPYGKKSLSQVKKYCLQICHWLVDQGVKLIIIACNTATVATLSAAQKEIPVPVVGVLDPGARAAANRTANNNIGVLATEATISSGAYENAILQHLPTANVVSVAAPKLVELAENGIKNFIDHYANCEEKSKVLEEYTRLVNTENLELAEGYAKPMRKAQVDTVVLGCTHFPLLKPLLNAAFGPYVMLVSCGRETVKDVAKILRNKKMLVKADFQHDFNQNEFYTTGANVQKFKEFGSLVFGRELSNVSSAKI